MSRESDWAYYRTFLAVSRLGSLSAAARALALTQPTVARHIEMLEADLGVELFVRSPRGLSPTAVAEAMRPQAAAIAHAAAALVRTAAIGKGEMAGIVRISASEVMGVERLPPILQKLREAHPALEIELALSSALHDVLGREVDIAVRQTAPTQGALLARKLRPTLVGLHAHKSYLKRRGEPRTITELAGHDLIGIETETPATRAILRAHPALENVRYALRTDSDVAQLAAIRAGVGIGMTHVAIAAQHRDLARVLADDVAIKLPLWIVTHEDLRNTPPCRAVFDALVDGLDAPLAFAPKRQG